jgi:SAM-dependent methyltransferase
VKIGEEFRALYRDDGLAADIDTRWLPWLLDGRGPDGDPAVDLGADVLTVSGGPATSLPAARVAGQLTVGDLADLDGTALHWPEARFSAVVALLALHHWPSPAEHDAVLAEWRRVLRPGGVLVGLSPIDGPHFRRLDADGRCAPVEPLGFPGRLSAAGFADVRVRLWSLVGFVGYRPEAAA